MLQQPHPGITTQWFAAPAIYADSWEAKKLPLVLAHIVLIGITAYLMYIVWGTHVAAAGTLALAIDPLLIAHTRVYAMDSLLAHFALLAVLALFAWSTTRNMRYMTYAGGAAALAVLSKLPGVFLVPFTGLYLVYDWIRIKPAPGRAALHAGTWTAAFAATLAIVLPSLVTNTIPVLQNIADFFASDDYTTLHPAGTLYYVRTLVFFTTPIQLLGIATLPFAQKALSRTDRQHIAWLLIFVTLFAVMMTLGAKKGDRYILPIFLMLDVVAALTIVRILTSHKTLSARRSTLLVIIGVILWQGAIVARIHPYELAYVNPITKPFFGERRLGWGEGLDIAAHYLNGKPNADILKAASYYPIEFGSHFAGETVPIHQWDTGNPDYVVAYRAMLERGETAWETDVLQQLNKYEPEHVIKLNGLEYVWIYNSK